MNKCLLIVSAVFPPEPVVSSKLSYDISLYLSSNNNVTVLCPKPTRPYGFNFGSNLTNSDTFTKIEMDTYSCPQSSFWGRFRENISFGNATAKYIKMHHKEIHAIYANTWPLFAQYLVVKAAKKNNIPIAVHIQDIYPESLTTKLNKVSKFINLILFPIDKYIFKNATSIIAISESMKIYLAKTRMISLNKISVVLNWQEEVSFLGINFSKKENDKFTFMYLGNIGPVAGIDLLIDSFILANIPDSKLVIAGSGSMKEALIKKASIYKDFDIQFWEVPEGKVSETQNKADVMLLPIKKGAAASSIPSKLPAYMFSAKPLICCADKDSDTARHIEKANCGYVVEPENIEELSKVLVSIKQQDTKGLQIMGARGQKYALDVFSKKNNLIKLTTVINNLLN